MGFTANCQPTAIGSLPHNDPRAACDLVLRHLPRIPFWPQLPRLSASENMYVQYCAGFPGLYVEDGTPFLDMEQAMGEGLEKLYGDYISQDSSSYSLSKESAAGFRTMLDLLETGKVAKPRLFKGQVTGPISQGLQVTDRGRRPVLYDEVVADALCKHLRLVAAQQELEMRRVCPDTIIFLDEPYLHAIGSAFIQLSAEQVLNSLEEVFGGIQGLKGIHCCANTDWPMLMASSVDVISFDALSYGGNIALFSNEVNAFLRRGGILAWGIVPNDDALLVGVSAESLVEKLEECLDRLVAKGVAKDLLLAQALITPICGLGSASEKTAERTLGLCADVSAKMRSTYGLED